MAKEEINIGVEGNDGTGDSIREAFRKVNENFNEIYAIFGLGGAIGFSSLNDTPDSLTRQDPNDPSQNLGNLVASTNEDGTAVFLRSLVGDGISVTVDDEQIVLSNTGGALSNDQTPKIGGPLDLQNSRLDAENTGFPIARVKIDEAAVQDFNAAHGLVGTDRITIDDLVIDKKYADKTFLSKYGDDSNGAVGLRDEPINTEEYFYNISSVDLNDNTARIVNHGFNSGINGKPFVFSGLTNGDLVPGNTYYIHRVSNDLITFHSTINDGESGLNPLIPDIGSIRDGFYDSNLSGNWKSNEGLPRKSVVRRQGDDMEGELYLSDHPGALTGINTGKKSDLQAATKFYVDANAGKVSSTMIYVSADGVDDNLDAPFSVAGRSAAYAFRTIGKAAELAEEIVSAAPVRPGPYEQTITANSGNHNSNVLFKGFTTLTQGDYPNTKALIAGNLEFLKQEVVSKLQENYPNFEFDSASYSNDVENLLNSVLLDLRSGNQVNVVTRIFALRFFYSLEGREKVGENFEKLSYAVNYLKAILPDVLANTAIPVTPGNTITQNFTGNNAESGADAALVALINIVLEIISGDEEGNPKGLLSAPPLIEGSTFKIEISNGSSPIGSVDQADPENFDIRQGKVVKGKTSGAIGRIVAYEQGGLGSTKDSVFLQLLEPKEFLLGEELTYGNFIKDVELSIRVDSGTYEEQYPIRVPQNVSIKGDEFRRVIVRPAEGISSSRWSRLYFYRDQQFDQLDLLPTFNPITVDKITQNIRFVVAETLAWIDDQIANAAVGSIWENFTFNKIQYRRDFNKVVDGVIKDIKFTGNANSYKNAKDYWFNGVSQVVGEQQQIADAILFTKNLLTNFVLTDTPYPSPLQIDEIQIIVSGTTEPDTVTITETLLDLISDVIVTGIEALSNLEDPRYGYHYLTNPQDPNSTPKENKDIDVFLMNDATILRNLSPTGHGGFMCVLDPDGQILTKSPYIQTGSSFSQTLNKKSFRGGMFVDAFVGNLPMVVTDVRNNGFELDVESLGGSGLFIKKPEMPAPFYIEGIRYQVNSVINYKKNLGKCTLILDKTSGKFDPVSETNLGFQETVPPYFSDDINVFNRSGGYQIILQTAGGRSMLANDFTQINDLGYGVVGRNGALIELVSMFTYYCHVAYYADSGAQIRSLNGSNAYGDYGIVAEGADPNEIPDKVELVSNMVQTAEIYDDGTNFTNRRNKLFVYVTSTRQIPLGRSEIEIDHGTVTTTDPDDPANTSTEDVGPTRYEISTVQDITKDNPSVVGTHPIRNTRVYKLGFSKEGLLDDVANGTQVIIRNNQNHLFDDVIDTTPIRPSTAVEFDEVAGDVYRSIAFEDDYSTGEQLTDPDQAIITVDATYDYLRLLVDQSRVGNSHPDTPGGYSGTLGATVGDRYVAIDRIPRNAEGLPDDVDRIQSGRFILAWGGRVHTLLGYVDKGTYAIIELGDYTLDDGTTKDDIDETRDPSVGIVQTLLSPGDYDYTLRAGLKGKGTQTDSVQDATITFQISTCRATGHDFLDIGTGGFNTTNYPNVIFGRPRIVPETPNPRETEDRTQGRCFYVSTDQDGFFRVGEFFTVDQGTGTISFEAAIALSNLDGLGFKRGVVITAFLTDTGMTDNATDAVPTQSAVRGYVNRRLGFDESGEEVPDWITRYLSLAGGSMQGTLDMNDNFITNIPDVLATEVNGTIAVNKRYVDGAVDQFSKLDSQYDAKIRNPEKNDLVVYTGLYRIQVENLQAGYDWGLQIGNTFTGTSGAQGLVKDATDISVRGNNFTIVSYELVGSSNQFLETDELAIGATPPTGGNEVAVISGGPFDEIANGHIGDNGDVRAEVSSPDADGSSSIDTVIDFYLNDTQIENRHISHTAGIDQYKLDLNPATTYPKLNVASITQNNLGVAAFDLGEFEATDGFVELKTNGISTTKLPSVNQNQLLGRLDADTGDMSVINFSDVVDQGGNFTNSGQGDGKIVKSLTGGGINAGNKLQINGSDFLAINASVIDIKASDGNTKLQVGSNIVATSNILPDNSANNRNLGNQTQKWNTVYATTFEGTATKAQYADLAENYLSDADYPPGTVLVFGGEQEVTQSLIKDDRKVAGVVTTNPAHLMNAELKGDYVIGLALQGRVPCKVIGKVEKGDIIVTSSVPGYAIVNNEPKTGAIIGKSLENKTDTEKGIIEVVVGRF